MGVNDGDIEGELEGESEGEREGESVEKVGDVDGFNVLIVGESVLVVGT